MAHWEGKWQRVLAALPSSNYTPYQGIPELDTEFKLRRSDPKAAPKAAESSSI